MACHFSNYLRDTGCEDILSLYLSGFPLPRSVFMYLFIVSINSGFPLPRCPLFSYQVALLVECALTVDIEIRVKRDFWSCIQKQEVNRALQSDTIDLGMPCNFTTLSGKCQATLAEVVDEQIGMICTIDVRQSIQSITKLEPSDLVSGPMKSILTDSQG